MFEIDLENDKTDLDLVKLIVPLSNDLQIGRVQIWNDQNVHDQLSVRNRSSAASRASIHAQLPVQPVLHSARSIRLRQPSRSGSRVRVQLVGAISASQTLLPDQIGCQTYAQRSVCVCATVLLLRQRLAIRTRIGSLKLSDNHYCLD